MYALYNTACCVNTAWYINLGLHWVTNHIHMFPMSHTLSKSVNISQRHRTANLTDILRISTYSTHDQQLDEYDTLPIEANQSDLPSTVSGVACLRRTHGRGKCLDMYLSPVRLSRIED
jgi:hypothetical protein